MPTGRIFNIQRCSTHDGPGIRTTVFLKGCNLSCAWCHNPESQTFAPALEYNEELCIHCGRCAEVCRNDVHETDRPALHRDRCTGCGVCEQECFAGALRLAGTAIADEDLMDEIRTDAPYFAQSGGGVTFSGGECMLQAGFLRSVCSLCREENIHVAIDTAGSVPWRVFEEILPFVDLFLYDIKALDADVHRQMTGADNKEILENLEKLLSARARVWVRVPCVPSGNDGEIETIADWLAGKPVECLELLAYHPLGGGKMKLLGLAPQKAFRVPSNEEMQHWLSLFTARGIPARIG
ncbi:MAG: glycyl-radical enzyme activating protein [Christensenellales bacterium]